MNLSPLPVQKFFANNGRPLVGGKLFTYAAGTNNKIATYKNQLGTAVNTNPIILDFRGEAQVWLDETLTYKFVLSPPWDSDPPTSPIWTVDGISSAPFVDTAQITQQFLGQILWPRTVDEIGAGVIPTNFGGSSRPWTDAVLRYGLVGDGTTDNTAAFTRMCSVAGQSLVIKRGDYVTGKFTLPGNTTLYLEPGTTIRDSGVLGPNDRFMNIPQGNIHIIGWGAQVLMDRADYPSGEQRHGVYINGAAGVWIEGLGSNSCGGDGFYVGGNAAIITLDRCGGDNNRRQGLSITSGTSIKVIEFRGTNTNGTAPAGGIDIEPNSPADLLSDIKIIRPYCVGNDGAGIYVALFAWNAISNYADIDIIEPYTSDNGGVSQSGRFRPGIDVVRMPSTTPCRGRIRIIDAVCQDEQNAGIDVYDWDVNGPRVEIIRPTIINPNQSQGNVSSVNSGLVLFNSGTFTTTPGNILIDTPIIRDDDGFLFANTVSPLRIGGIWDLIEIRNPLITFAGNPWSIDNAAAEIRFSTITPIVSAQGTTQTFTDGRYLGRIVTNAAAGATITYTLNAASANRIGWQYSFEVTSAQELRIDPAGTDAFRGAAAGQYMVSSTIGDNVTIECDSATTWKIVSRYGSWSFV